MTKKSRFGIAAAAALAFVPAFGSDVSEDKRETEQTAQQPADAAAPLAMQVDPGTQEIQQRAYEGSAGGEPANQRDEDKRMEQKEAARERFLNEVWSAPSRARETRARATAPPAPAPARRCSP